jgi:hypothetical protein
MGMSIDIDEASNAISRELHSLREQVSSLTAQCEAYRVSYEIVNHENERLRVDLDRSCRLADMRERERDLAEAVITNSANLIVEYRKATRGDNNAVPPKPRVNAGDPYSPPARPRVVDPMPKVAARD